MSEPGPSFAHLRVVKEADTVMLQLPSGEIRSTKIDPKTSIHFGKYGSFPGRELIGKPYGFTYEIVDKTLTMLPPQTIEELDDTDANNELINDGDFVQPLTYDEIENLKKSGAHASEIIKKQIEQHANYDLKTEFSKDKYKKRKEAKFSKKFTLIEPTMFNVCQYWFAKDPGRVRDLRPDALGQIMSYANVRPASKVLITDDTGGLIIASVLERLGGKGRVVAISDAIQAPAYPCLAAMNFAPEHMAPLDITLNWGHTEEDWTPIHDYTEEPSTRDGNDEAISRKLERESVRVQKRRQNFLALQACREELFAGEWDALIVASQYEPFSIVEKLSPYLAGSASVVIQSPHLQILTEAHTKMRTDPQFLGAAITESWTRQYQVLPGRTHPLMSTSGSGGYLLHCYRVYDNDAAKSTLSDERRLRRQKVAEAKRRRRAAESGAPTGESHDLDEVGPGEEPTDEVQEDEDIEMETVSHMDGDNDVS